MRGYQNFTELNRARCVCSNGKIQCSVQPRSCENWSTCYVPSCCNGKIVYHDAHYSNQHPCQLHVQQRNRPSVSCYTIQDEHVLGLGF